MADFLSESSRAAITEALPVITTVTLVIATLVLFLCTQKSKYPIVNAPAWYEPTVLKRLEFLKHGAEIYDNARKQYANRPFKMICHVGEATVLPTKYADVIRNERRLTFGKSITYVSKRDRYCNGLDSLM